MKTLAKFFLLGTCALSGPVMSNVSVGPAIDMGIGVGIQINDRVNIMVGSAGVSFDYLFLNQVALTTSEQQILLWNMGIGGGAYWDNWGPKAGDFTFRVPLGLQFKMTPRWNGYVQVIPFYAFGADAYLSLGLTLGVRYLF